jgi:hypothetical protein
MQSGTDQRRQTHLRACRALARLRRRTARRSRTQRIRRSRILPRVPFPPFGISEPIGPSLQLHRQRDRVPCPLGTNPEGAHALTNPKRLPEIEIRRAGDDVIVHDPTHARVHVLNETAGHVLELCDGTQSVDEIARSLCRSTGADLSVVSSDVSAILREFGALQMLVI